MHWTVFVNYQKGSICEPWFCEYQACFQLIIGGNKSELHQTDWLSLSWSSKNDCSTSLLQINNCVTPLILFIDCLSFHFQFNDGNVFYRFTCQLLMQTNEVSKVMKQTLCTIFWIVKYMYARIKDLPIKVNWFHFQTIGDWIDRLKLIDWCTATCSGGN